MAYNTNRKLRMEYSSFINTLSIIGTMVLPATGVAYGQNMIAQAMSEALQQQPAAHKKLTSLYVIALAIIETSAILCLLLAFMMAFTNVWVSGPAIGHLSIFFVVAIPSFLVGMASGKPARAALAAVARYPFNHAQVLNTLLLGLSMLQSPVILGFITALLIKSRIHDTMSITHALLFMAASICTALGCMGPTYGLSYFSERVCQLLGKEPQLYKQIITFVFLSQALIETPLIFVFVLGLVELFYLEATPSVVWTAFSASIALGLSTLGAGISSGKVAAHAAQAIGRESSVYPLVTRMSLLAQTILDTAPIYGLITALVIIFLH